VANVTEPTTAFLDAWASAVVARQVARDVLQHLHDSADDEAPYLGFTAAAAGHDDELPLDTAIRDLAVATLAASRATETACRNWNVDQARAIGEAACLAATALSVAEGAREDAADAAGPAQRLGSRA
jgi:hypothetical protein